jgi:hypothetical protein
MFYGLGGEASIPGRGKDFTLHSIQTGSGAHPAFNLVGTGGSFLGGKRQQGVKLTTYLHLVLRLGMVELYLHYPYIFIAWY